MSKGPRRRDVAAPMAPARRNSETRGRPVGWQCGPGFAALSPGHQRPNPGCNPPPRGRRSALSTRRKVWTATIVRPPAERGEARRGRHRTPRDRFYSLVEPRRHDFSRGRRRVTHPHEFRLGARNSISLASIANAMPCRGTGVFARTRSKCRSLPAILILVAKMPHRRAARPVMNLLASDQLSVSTGCPCTADLAAGGNRRRMRSADGPARRPFPAAKCAIPPSRQATCPPTTISTP
jgi:hypothetical protein